MQIAVRCVLVSVLTLPFAYENVPICVLCMCLCVCMQARCVRHPIVTLPTIFWRALRNIRFVDLFTCILLLYYIFMRWMPHQRWRWRQWWRWWMMIVRKLYVFQYSAVAVARRCWPLFRYSYFWWYFRHSIFVMDIAIAHFYLFEMNFWARACACRTSRSNRWQMNYF